MSDSGYTVILFYKFVPIADPAALRDTLHTLAAEHHLKGRLLIAHEGINGTFEGLHADVASYQAALRSDPRFADIGFKESAGTGDAFRKIEVRVRDEVVTLGAGAFDIPRETAPAITPAELEEMYANDDDFVVLDLRNDYEIAAGQFERTIDPKLSNFRDLPGKLSELGDLKTKKVVTVCTGGIRCEKATCLLQREGFTNVVQLKDGIHTYMQQYPARHFKGTLFVFDNRMVTPVVDSPTRAMIGACAFCGTTTEDFYSDDRERPSKKVMCCTSCIRVHDELRSCTV